jgi:hypothetical protein
VPLPSHHEGFKIIPSPFYQIYFHIDPGELSRYSDGLRDERPEFDSGRSKIVLFSIRSRPALGATQPLVQWVPGAASPEVKRQGCEADHSPPSSAEVKNGGAIPSLPIYLHGVLFI